MPVSEAVGVGLDASTASSAGLTRKNTVKIAASPTKGAMKPLLRQSTSIAKKEDALQVAEVNDDMDDDEPKRFTSTPFKKKIVGDLFGVTEEMHKNDGLDGLMYRSRVQSTEIEALRAIGKGEARETVDHKEKKTSSVSDDISVFDDNSEDEPEQLESMNSRQQLAMTIRNWTTIPENDSHIIDEGAVHALIGLASMDDNFIKKCCARALNQLASRESNRERLLALGAATGVVQISMSARVWKIAKLCAQTLCSFSMYSGGEAVMAGEGAILALVVLLGLKGHRLLPVCSQALYNLTCIKEHFKGVERTVKAFLAMPSSVTDTSLWFLKSLVNCCRFSWIRMRVIEDGALPGVAAIIPTLHERPADNRDEIVYLIAVAIRLLSESSGCRIELIAKGALDILRGITPHCTNRSRCMTIKALYNIIQHPLNNTHFEISATIAVDLAMSCSNRDPVVMELCSACFYAFTAEGLRGNTALANRIMDALPRCLGETAKPLTQYYSVTCAGNIFFMENTDSVKLEMLIEKVISMGDTLTDLEAIEALTVALAKLSQDEFSMNILKRRGLFDMMLRLILQLLAKSGEKYVTAKETSAVAICRIALKIGIDNLSGELKKSIADSLMGLLQCENLGVLESAIGAIRALGDVGICNNDFMVYKDTLFTRLAGIVKMYGDGHQSLCRNCCALFANYSYLAEAHLPLSQDAVMEVLFLTTKSDDKFTRETVAITICNMTVSPEASDRLIKNGVCGIIATLSGATSEEIQHLCAKCICNLSCSEQNQKVIIAHGVLQTVLLIALVRTVEDKTKMLCARAIMNMISDSNIDALKEAGVVRVFASIAAIMNHTTQNQCAQGYLIFSTTKERREDVCSRKPVMQALFLMIKSSSPLCRILVGMTVCNLLSCENSQRAAISAGALQVLKIISTMEYPQLREASARVIINLMQVKSLYPALQRSAPIVPMINYILHHSNTGEPIKSESYIESNPTISGDIFDCAVNSMSCISQAEEFREHIYSAEGVQALIVAVLSGKVKSVATATEVIRTFCLLSYEFDSTSLLIKSQVILALLFLYRRGLVQPKSAEMICLLIRNCSTISSNREELISHGTIYLMRAIQRPMVDRSIAIARSVIIAILEFSHDEDNHEVMVEHGIVELLYNVVFPTLGDRSASDELFPVQPNDAYASFKHNDAYERSAAQAPSQAFPLSSLDIERLSVTFKNLTKTSNVHEQIVNGNFIGILEAFLNGAIEDKSRGDIAEAICCVSSTRSCRQKLVNMQAIPLLLRISKETTNVKTQTSCTVALGYLSEITVVMSGAVSSLLELTVTKEDDYVDGRFKSKGDATEESGALNENKTDATDADYTDATGDASAETSKNNKSKLEADKLGQPKSLRQMIKSGLLNSKNKMILKTGGAVIDGVMVSNSSKADEDLAVGKKKKGPAGALVGRLRSITAFDMNSAESLSREKDGLKTDYSKYSFKIFDNSGSFGVEYGGIAVRHAMHLALPSVVQHNSAPDTSPLLENTEKGAIAERAAGMTKLPVSQEPLEKDIRFLDIDALAALVDQKEKEIEDALQQEAPAPDNTQGRSSPTAIDAEEHLHLGGSSKSKNRKSINSSNKSGGSAKIGIDTKVVTGAGNAWAEKSTPGSSVSRRTTHRL